MWTSSLGWKSCWDPGVEGRERRERGGRERGGRKGLRGKHNVCISSAIVSYDLTSPVTQVSSHLYLGHSVLLASVCGWFGQVAGRSQLHPALEKTRRWRIEQNCRQHVHYIPLPLLFSLHLSPLPSSSLSSSLPLQPLFLSPPFTHWVRTHDMVRSQQRVCGRELNCHQLLQQ